MLSKITNSLFVNALHYFLINMLCRVEFLSLLACLNPDYALNTTFWVTISVPIDCIFSQLPRTARFLRQDQSLRLCNHAVSQRDSLRNQGAKPGLGTWGDVAVVLKAKSFAVDVSMSKVYLGCLSGC